MSPQVTCTYLTRMAILKVGNAEISPNFPSYLKARIISRQALLITCPARFCHAQLFESLGRSFLLKPLAVKHSIPVRWKVWAPKQSRWAWMRRQNPPGPSGHHKALEKVREEPPR